MADLAAKLREADAAGARFKLIATNGVSRWTHRRRPAIDLRSRDRTARWSCRRFARDRFVGEGGRGTPEHCGVGGASTSHRHPGKALAARRAAIPAGGRRSSNCCDSARGRTCSRTRSPQHRQRVLSCSSSSTAPKARRCAHRVRTNGERFRAAMTALGFGLVPASTRSFGDAGRCGARDAAWPTRCCGGVYVIGLLVPGGAEGQGALRTQMSAAHTDVQIDRAVAAFAKVGRALGAIP